MAYEDREKLVSHARDTRDHKLKLSDIDMLRSIESAASFSAFATARAEWVAYRNALRDYPAQFPDPLEDDLSNAPEIPLSPLETAQAQEA
tara:strand:+ start:145 stop:414 length:270 start_codon:yes stop_codon:yes gene_type:complete